MNIKKLTLIATAVSALSLSPLTYARTEATDMSIIGIEPECSYFADLRFHGSPFGSRGDITGDTGDKGRKFDFDKISWGGSIGVGTEISPAVEVSVVAGITTGIGTSDVQNQNASSDKSTTPTPASSGTSTVKKLSDEQRRVYNSWLGRNPDALDFLRTQFSSKSNRNELHKLLASKSYNMRGAIVHTPGDYTRFGNRNTPADANSVLIGDWVKGSANRLQERYRSLLYVNNTANNENYLQRLGDLISKSREVFGNDASFNNLKNTVRITGLDDLANGQALDAVRGRIAERIQQAGDHITTAIIDNLRQNTIANVTAENWAVILNSTSTIFDSFFNDITEDNITLSAHGVYLGTLYKGSRPQTGALDAAGPNAGARTYHNAYHIKVGNDVNNDAVRQLFFHEMWANNLLVMGDMIAAAEADVHVKLNKMIADILATHKDTPQYKKLLEGLEAELKKSSVTGLSAQEIIDIIVAESQAEESKAKKDEESKNNETAKASTTDSTKKPINVDLTKFRVGIEVAYRLIDTDSGSLAILLGGGATALSGTIAAQDTGWMWGADLYAGVKGEYAISESIALTAKYTWTPGVFGATLSEDVKKAVKTLGYTDDAKMSALSIHELSLGVRFYF